MHDDDDVGTTRKTKQPRKSKIRVSRVVTTDTTNKDPRPEDPRRGTGKARWTIGSSDDVSISSTPLTRVVAPVDNDALQSGSSEDRTY